MLIIFILLIYVNTHNCVTPPTCSLIINGDHQDIPLVPPWGSQQCVSSITRVPIRTIYSSTHC